MIIVGVESQCYNAAEALYIETVVHRASCIIYVYVHMYMYISTRTNTHTYLYIRTPSCPRPRRRDARLKGNFEIPGLSFIGQGY